MAESRGRRAVRRGTDRDLDPRVHTLCGDLTRLRPDDGDVSIPDA
jgi:hypothetical protein